MMCLTPAIASPLALTLTAKAAAPSTVMAQCGVTFDPDPNVLTSITLAE